MIAFGIAVSTVLGRFVIPIYYVLGERLRGPRDRLGSGRARPRRPTGTGTPSPPSPTSLSLPRWGR